MKNSIAILSVLTSLLFCLGIGGAFGHPALGVGLFGLDIFAAVAGLIPGGAILSTCGVAAAAILYDCTNPLVGGTDTVMYVTNRADVSSVTKDGSNNLIITAITMVATKKFFKLEGASGSNGSSVHPNYKTVKLAYGKAYEHQVDAVAFKVDPATKKELEGWNLADLCVIVQNKFKGSTGNCAFEIYGLDGGLMLESLERDPMDKDTMGAFKMSFKTQETSREPHMPYSFFITDYATTLAAVNALL